MAENNSSGGGSLLPALLGTLFIGLKLTGYINWPWLWVLAPFWVPVAISAALLFAVGLVYTLEQMFRK